MRIRLTNAVPCTPLAMFSELVALLGGATPTISIVLSRSGEDKPTACGVAANAFWWKSGNGASLVFGARPSDNTTYMGGEHRSFNAAVPTTLPESVLSTSGAAIDANAGVGSITIDFVYRPDYSGIAYTNSTTRGGFMALNKPNTVLSSPLGRTLVAASGDPASVSSASWLWSYDCPPGSSSAQFTRHPACMAIGSSYGLFDGVAFSRRPIQVGSVFLGDVNDLGAEVFVNYHGAAYADEFVLNGENYRGWSVAGWSYGFVIKEQ